MQFSTIIVSALAAVVSAAPTAKEARGAFDKSQFNNFAFNSQNVGYLSAVNSLDFNVLAQLAQVNNFNLNSFQSLFSGNSFDVQQLLLLQQAQVLIQLQSVGVLGQFDLSSLVLNNVNLGLINNVGSFDLGSLIDQSLVPSIQQVIQQSSVVITSI